MYDTPAELHTYGFRFAQGKDLPAQLYSTGWERITSTSYYWDGLKRKDHDQHLFQYTLSGFGELRMENKTVRLTPGKAFMVSIPGEHVYYFPRESESWEFIYIMLHGFEVKKVWNHLASEHDSTPAIDPRSKPIRTLLDIYHQADQIHDAYHGSALAYRFIMELQRWSLELDRNKNTYPESIRKALQFIQAHYDQDIGLEDIAAASGLSKHHFGRMFKRLLNEPPARYVTKKRVEKATELLRYTTLNNEEIAKRTGFANANYFCKVFREYVGTSPQNFRNGHDMLPVQQVLFD